MGVFNVTCVLTRLPIEEFEPVVLIVLARDTQPGTAALLAAMRQVVEATRLTPMLSGAVEFLARHDPNWGQTAEQRKLQADVERDQAELAARPYHRLLAGHYDSYGGVLHGTDALAYRPGDDPAAGTHFFVKAPAWRAALGWSRTGRTPASARHDHPGLDAADRDLLDFADYCQVAGVQLGDMHGLGYQFAEDELLHAGDHLLRLSHALLRELAAHPARRADLDSDPDRVGLSDWLSRPLEADAGLLHPGENEPGKPI